MKRTAAFALLLAACSQESQQSADNSSQPVTQAEVNHVAPPTTANEIAPPVSAQPGDPADAATPPAPHMDPNVPPPEEKSALGAARRLQAYCDAVATKRYGDAYAFWGDGGKRSGLTLAQFRESFAKYAAYDCHLYTPGDMEGAAGSSYVTIPLKVTGNTVFMRDLHVTFSSGAGYDVPIRFLFLPGSSSRIIDLPGAARFIRRVDMTYSKLPGGGTAVVTLLGYKL